jgi:hypothetical protein
VVVASRLMALKCVEAGWEQVWCLLAKKVAWRAAAVEAPLAGPSIWDSLPA